MNPFWRILTVHSVRDLFKFKSFALLILLLIVLDQWLSGLASTADTWPAMPGRHDLGQHWAAWVFTELPGIVAHALTDVRTFTVVLGLFLLKQLISMWPSSDMRRMHRQERGRFGLVTALIALQSRQIIWDAMVLGMVGTLVGLWSLAGFTLGFIIWQQTQSAWSLLLPGMLVGGVSPLVMAALSYSSKLAVISRGDALEKLGLFFQLLRHKRLRTHAWLFFLARLIVETLFVAAIPSVVMLLIPMPWLRVVLAAMIATPVYAYLKMATFKFFLLQYLRLSLVR